MHEAVNKFVVYEKFAEMTHKYDVQQFGKLLEEYNSVDELSTIRIHLGLDADTTKVINNTEEDKDETS